MTSFRYFLLTFLILLSLSLSAPVLSNQTMDQALTWLIECSPSNVEIKKLNDWFEAMMTDHKSPMGQQQVCEDKWLSRLLPPQHPSKSNENLFFEWFWSISVFVLTLKDWTSNRWFFPSECYFGHPSTDQSRRSLWRTPSLPLRLQFGVVTERAIIIIISSSSALLSAGHLVVDVLFVNCGYFLKL